MIKLKKILNLFLSLTITSLFLVILIMSFFVSPQSLSNESSLSEAHSLFLVSHLDYYHSLNQHEASEDSTDMDHHEHKHRHSENGEEHSHEHLSTVAFSDFSINQGSILKIHSIYYNDKVISTYNPIISDPAILKILRPPIFT